MAKAKAKVRRSFGLDKRLVGLVLLAVIVFGVVALIKVVEKSMEGLVSYTGAVKSTTQYEMSKLVSFVDEAAVLVQEKGESAFPDFEAQGGKWYNSDNYIFVYDMDGNTLVLPPQKSLEGTNRMEVKDVNGVYFVKNMIDTLKTKDSGWVEYQYPRPGDGVSSKKLAYFKKAVFGGKIYLVGSGVYSE